MELTAVNQVTLRLLSLPGSVVEVHWQIYPEKKVILHFFDGKSYLLTQTEVDELRTALDVVSTHEPHVYGILLG